MTAFSEQNGSVADPAGHERGPPPTGTVTLLFSDIEGSTRLVQHLGEVYVEVLRVHHQVLRTAIRQTQGWEIDTAGDGFFVCFFRARDAVKAAVAAQRALAAQVWPNGAVVRVRMGLHTGEPLLTAGSYVGLDVHRAARICTAGHGGQVLLSLATRKLVEQDLPPGVHLRDLGAHRLKDVVQPERLFQLIIPGLPAEFPPLRSLADRQDNLPTPPTVFVGRVEEVNRVRHLLRRDTVRLVTLTGPGGTGKTRLSIEVASGLKEDFSDGVCYVPLASIADPGLVAATIVKALGLAENPAHSALEGLKAYLYERAMLLVLDNFEQVVEAASVVAELVAACPEIKVLVTSRVVLRIGGEHEVSVPPLPLPDPGRSCEELQAYPAVALFVERVQAVQSGFALTGENAPAVAHICRQVDGLPLAIELAAARIKFLSPHALLARLGSRLDLLKGGARDAPLRHQALRQTVAWSYELLSPDEQAFFRRMAVFMGGCTLEAADQVCRATSGPDGAGGGDDWESPDAFDSIAALVDQSLLRREEGVGAEPRFTMLETIREYGAEQLREAGEVEAVGRAHAAYYLALVERVEPELTGPSQAMWMDLLEAEHDNLRAALAWAEAQDGVTGLRLGAALWRFWVARGHMREGLHWFQRLLDLPDARERSRMRMRALIGAGTLAHEMSEIKTARGLLEESLAIGRELGDKRGVATVLNNLGWLAGFSSEFEAQRALSEEALELCRELGYKRGRAVAMNNLGFWAGIRGDLEKAVPWLEESLALRLDIGDHRGAAYEGTYLGWLDHLQGRREQGRARIEKALEVHRELGDRQGIANTLGYLGNVWCDLGHSDRAWVLLEESVSLWKEVGNRIGLAEGLQFLSRALRDLGRLDQARNVLEESLVIYTELELKWGVAGALHLLGRVAMVQGHEEEARAFYLESLALWQEDRGRLGTIECLEDLGMLFGAQGRFERAARLLATVESARETLGIPLQPCRQADHARDVTRLRSELGEELFAEVWNEGRAMSLDEAVALAPGDG